MNNYRTRKLRSTLFALACVLSASFLLAGCATEEKAIGNKNGDKAPEISSYGIDGKQINLSETKGKLVLVEFWCASSSTCRKNHYEIERLYKMYHDTEFKNGSGFTVYSVSLESNKDIWKQALREDAITWMHNVCDFSGWHSKAAIDYEINTLPKYYLLDENGLILQKNILIKDFEKIILEYKS